MNTERMGEHLSMISTEHPDELVLLVVDNASSHKAKGLDIPDNIRLCPLPPYSPELNPQEQVWKKMRAFFANRIFSTMEKCVEHIDNGIARLGQAADEVKQLTNWSWIKVSS
jgi:transposase